MSVQIITRTLAGILGLALAVSAAPAAGAAEPEDPATAPAASSADLAALEGGAEPWAAATRTRLPEDGAGLSAEERPGLRYTVVDLGDGAVTNASDVNEDGLAVGTIFLDGHGEIDGRAIPVAWHGDRLIWLDSGAAGQRPQTRAISVGDDGTIGGWQRDPQTGIRYAVTWTPDENGRYGDLRRVSEVTGWEDNVEGGEVDSVSPTGSLLVTEPRQHVPFGNDVILRGGSATPLPPAAPYSRGVGTYDANASGTATGYSSDGHVIRATNWRNGGPQLLPELIPDALSRGAAVNDDGDTVVEALVPSIGEMLTVDEPPAKRGVAILRDGGYEELPDLHGDIPGDSNLHAWDINNRDDVVGSADVWKGPEATTRAFLWSGGRLLDLNDTIAADEGWELLSAHAINERGQIVGIGIHDGVLSAFMLDPTRPMLFVPGAGASILKSFDDPTDPEELWLGCGRGRIRLSRFPEDGPDQDVRAVDATRYLDCGVLNGRWFGDLNAYGGMLDQLRTTYGYREYQVEEKVERFTTEGCDLSQRGDGPTLFVFAYDWRQDNRVSARQLEDYIGCIQKFYPDTEIDVATHSMGSLVARRYIMNNRGQTGLHKVVTIGAPWLGAPKLVNVLNTGDFALPVAFGDTVKHIVSGFPAAHQLMAGPRYHELAGSAFTEDGWDFDGDGVTTERYDWRNLREAFDARWPRTVPAETAQVFQEEGGADGQADWSADSTGEDYTHIYGIQRGRNTIGSTAATRETFCTPLDMVCVTRDYFEETLTEGDGTVPTTSANRTSADDDLNAPGATLVPVPARDSGENASVEHTALTRHPKTLATMIATFREDDRALRTALAGAEAEEDATAPYRYVTVRGAREVVLHDTRGLSDEPIAEGVRLRLPGSQHLSQGRDADLVTMPADAAHSWRVTFTGLGQPLSVESLVGTQQAPETATRWRDLVVPEGHAAELVMTPTGVERLRIDRDGDGTLEETVPPAADVSGTDARDVTAPMVSLTSMSVDGRERYAVRAEDEEGGSGVREIFYSVDGESFATYDVPVAVPASATLHAFAEDHAGNRSAVVELAASAASPGPVTRLTLDPDPEGGWSPGTTTATLAADSGDAGGIREIQYRTSGAQTTDLRTVASARATVVVEAPGRTTLWFRAVAADGTTEPWQQRVLRIDADDPSAQLRSPVADAVVGSLGQVSGTAQDTGSGVRAVEVTLERTGDGTWWDGAAWTDEPTWLRAAGTTTWRMTDLPEAPATGGYAVRVRVTDAAGRTATTGATTFTLDHPRPYDVTELAAPAGSAYSTSATDVDDRGTAVGAGGFPADALVWDADGARALATPAGHAGAHARATASDGSVVGETDEMNSTALRWEPDGTVHQLPHLPGESRSRAAGVSAAGVAGWSGQRPVWWPGDRAPVALALPEGATEGWALDIDAGGTIVGRVTTAEGDFAAALWTEGGRRVSLLGTLGGATSEATSINEVGQVVGWAATGTGSVRPFVVDIYSGDPMREIYVPSTHGVAHDIGDDGTVVGEYTTGSGDEVGFVARPGQDAKPMWSLLPQQTGWSIARAVAVNRPGQVVGFGINEGRPRGYLATTPHAPTAQDVVVDTDEDTAVEVRLVGLDVDPGTRLRWTVEDGPGHGTLGAVDGDRVTYTPERGFDGTDTFTVRAADGALRSNLATVTVRVRPGVDTNQRPVAVVTAPATAAEGGTVALDGSASSDADGRVTAYAWDLDADGEYDDASGPVAELRVPREGLRTVALRVTDDAGATGDASAAVQVVNVAPIVTLPPTARVAAGERLVLEGSFADPGEDAWDATVDTGAGREALELDGRGFRVATGFDEPGDRTVEVRVCDGTDCGTATTVVTVRDRLAARIEAPDIARESDTVALDGSGSLGTPADEAAYAWDLDGDGSYDDATGATASLPVPQDGAYSVALRVTDEDGRTDTTTHTVSVTNVVPAVTLPATANAVVGTPWSLAGSFADPGADAWTATVDHGSGAAGLALTGKAFTVGHTFTAAGSRPVTVLVCDDDGCGTARVVVTVAAAPPATWPWQGFFAPVDNLPVVNTVKAGQAIPMKFSLGGDRGLDIFADGSPVAVRHSCGTTGGTDSIEQTVTAGSSELTYHAGSDRYQYVWKTPKAWAGQCRTFRMVLRDGSVHEAEFRFR